MALSVDITIPNLVFLGVIVLAIKKLIQLFKKYQLEKLLEKHEASAPKDKVLLHTIWRCKTLPSISPYGLKLETYLRMSKIPYEIEVKDGFSGPTGKVPWITYNGVHMADSHMIIQFLNKKFSINLNKNVKEEQVAIAKACRLMMENHFMWGLAQFRWIDNLSALSSLMKFPAIFKLLAPLNSWKLKKRMADQGIGKHTVPEIYEMTEDDLRTISKILGNKKYFGGDEPCEEDCALFGGLSQCVWAASGSSFERLVNGELRNLKEYCERMKNLYWPDWESCIDRS